MASEVRLIDANALCLHIKRHGILLGDEDATDEQRERYMLRVVSEQPTIDPETLRPTGRWDMRGGKRYCTNCGKRACVTRDSEDFWYTVGTDYCPNYGAKMTDNEGE